MLPTSTAESPAVTSVLWWTASTRTARWSSPGRRSAHSAVMAPSARPTVTNLRTTPSRYSARTPTATRCTPRSHGTPTPIRRPAPWTWKWRTPGSSGSSSHLSRSRAHALRGYGLAPAACEGHDLVCRRLFCRAMSRGSPAASITSGRQLASIEEGTLMTTETVTTAGEQIRALLNERAAAITARDARRAVAHYAPDVVSFSLAPPLRYTADEVRDSAGIEGWFQTWDGPIGYDIGELVIEAGDDVAFCHGLTHMTGTKTDGERVDLWFRSTVGLRRTAAGWQITHEHDSTPFHMDGSGRAATDLRP